MIEWKPNAAKWQQIADLLKARIEAGEYEPDTALPSQHAIVTEFDVAPGTAQKVLRRLREQGWAYSVQGVGTFVTSEEQRRKSAQRD